MAVSARELFLIIRAQNQASGALRRISRDVGGLRNLQRMQLDRQRVILAGDQLRISRDLARQEQARILSGTRGISLERARLAQSIARQRAEITLMGAGQQQLRQQEAMLRNQVQRARLARAMQTVRDPAIRADLSRLSTAAAIAAQRLQIEEDRVGRKVAVANEALAAQQGNMRQLAAREAEAAQRAAYLTQRQAHLSESIALNAARVRELNREISRARWDRIAVGGRVIQHLGVVAQYAGLAIGGALAFAAHGAANFNTQIALAGTQVGNTTRQVVADSAQMQRAVLNLMAGGRTTAQMDDLSSALYDIFSSLTFAGTQRQQVQQGTQLLNIFSRAAIGGMTNITDVTHAGITALNDFADQGGNQVQQMTRLMNRMFAAVRFGRMTFAEFVSTMGTTAPAAKAANQSFDQLAGAMAFLTRRIPNVRMAATSYARLLEVFQRPEFQAGLKSFGVNITDANNKLIPLEQIITRIVERFPRLARGERNPAQFFKFITAAGGSPTGLVGTIQARRAFTFLVRDVRGYRMLLGQVVNDQNEFSKSFRALADTSAVKWQLFLRQIQAFAIEIGEEAIPAITQLARPVMEAVRWFNRLDSSTKTQIGRWAVYGAAILLAAGAISFTVGVFIRFYALLSRGIGFWNGTLLVLALVVAAVGVLEGGWRSLDDAMRGVLDFSFGDFTGFAITLGITTVAVIRLVRVLRDLQIAYAATATAQGLAARGGIAGALVAPIRAARDFRTLRAVRLAERAEQAGVTIGQVGLAGRFAASAEAGAAAFGASLGTLGLIGLAVGGVAGGLYLWKRHLDAAHRAAMEVEREIENTRRIAQQPLRFAAQFGRLGDTAREVERARNRITQIREEIAQARRSGAARSYLRGLTLDLADAEEALFTAQYKSNRAFRAFSAELAAMGRNSRAISDTQQRLRQLARLRDLLAIAPTARLRGTPAFRQIDQLLDQLGISPSRVNDAIRVAQARLNILRAGIQQGTNRVRAQFDQQVRSLARTGGFRVTPASLSDMFRVALQRGRMLTLPEIRAFVRAELDPAFRRRVPRDVRSAIAAGLRRRFIIRYQLQHPEQRQIDAFHHRLERLAADPLRRQEQILQRQQPGARTALIFAQVVSRANLGPVGDRAIRVGAAITEGMARGVRQHGPDVNRAVVVVALNALDAGAGALGARSPSREAERRLGLPFVQGLAMGISRNRLLAIQAASQLTLDLFQGPVIQNLVQGQRTTMGTLTADLRGQLAILTTFNTGLLQLAQRGAPTALLQQLASLGSDGAKYINILANSSDPQLQRYVKLWQSANQQIVQSTGDTAAVVRRELPQAVQDARQQIQGSLQNLQQMYETALQQEEQYFGQLFQGPYMQSARMQNRVDWGAILRPQDLLRDLQSQVRAFQQYHAQLDRLRRRGAPESLLKAIEELGPEAQKQLAVLLRLNPRQWAQYLATWRRGQRDVHSQAMRDLNRQLRSYRRFGNRIALAIIAGIRDENVGLQRALRLMLHRMFPELFRRARQSSTGATTPQRTRRSAEHTHYHLHPSQKDGTLTQQLRKLHFQSRHRKRV